MGLMDGLARLAARRPRCYVVEAPGGATLRRSIEAALDDRGWRTARAPAHADALVIAGELPDPLERAAELLWSQLPGPRCRLDVTRPADVDPALEGLPGHLAVLAPHAQDAVDRIDEVDRWVTTQDGHGGHDHGGHEGHDGHDHDGMSMSPSGVALAEGAEDRDGLEMDELLHPWGPLLDHWPGGLELQLQLHGDVVAGAEARWWGQAGARPWTAVEGWDAIATTLALAGDDLFAHRARVVRDGDDLDASRVSAQMRRLARLGVIPTSASGILSAFADGDLPAGSANRVDPTALVQGLDLADARLVLAAHGPVLARDRAEDVSGRHRHDSNDASDLHEGEHG